MERYSRQALALGIDVESKVHGLSVLIAGCGALGTAVAESLARMGVKKIVAVDADVVELSNLHRVHLFTERDVGRPKVDVCRERVNEINSEVEFESHHDVISPENAERYVSIADIVVDALDSLYPRLVLNDACVKLNKPLIYAGVNREYITVKLVIPKETSCLSCFINYQPEGANVCETLGTVITATTIAANLEVQLILDYLRGYKEDELIIAELDSLTFQKVKMRRNPNCRTCMRQEFPFLKGEIPPGQCDLLRVNERSEVFRVVKTGSYVKICYPEGCFIRRR